MTRDDLLRAILENPGDDTPRLAYADEIEMTEPERAEFIRDCVGTLSFHTDCPIRLADLQQGRPVPLRCGACNYCVARQRAEKYYARHPWVDGVPYAVAFEPTPLDGDMPTGPGLTLIVRRGFVSEIRDPLAVLMGGECGRCTGHGTVERNGSDYTCPACSGTGRVPGIGRDLFLRQPVTRVEVTGREPVELSFGWEYLVTDRTDEPNGVPWGIAEANDRGLCKTFPTSAAARDALSDALVAHFREQAGLPPLEIT